MHGATSHLLHLCSLVPGSMFQVDISSQSLHQYLMSSHSVFFAVLSSNIFTCWWLTGTLMAYSRLFLLPPTLLYLSLFLLLQTQPPKTQDTQPSPRAPPQVCEMVLFWSILVYSASKYFLRCGLPWAFVTPRLRRVLEKATIHTRSENTNTQIQIH